MPTSTRTPHVRFYDTSRKNRNCQTGGQGRPPLQDVLRFRRKCVQFCDRILPGRCGHRPLRTSLGHQGKPWTSANHFFLRKTAGGAKPLPYITTNRAAAQKPLQLIIVRANVLKVSVLHAEALGDRAELDKAEALVEMAGVEVRRHDSVELHHAEAVRLCLL